MKVEKIVVYDFETDTLEFDGRTWTPKREAYRAGIEAAAKHMDALGMLHAAMAIRGLPDLTPDAPGGGETPPNDGHRQADEQSGA